MILHDTNCIIIPFSRLLDVDGVDVEHVNVVERPPMERAVVGLGQCDMNGAARGARSSSELGAHAVHGATRVP